MKKLLKLDYIDTYILAMMYRGHSIANILKHLGYGPSTGTQRIAKIESVCGQNLTFRSKTGSIVLNEAGLVLAKTCLGVIEAMEPGYSEPKFKLNKECDILQ